MLTFCPISAFMSVDLPTLGRPTMATCPQRYGSALKSTSTVDLRERRLRRGLLGRTAAAAATGPHDLQGGDAAFHVECLRMGLACRADDRVLGHAHAVPLQVFLEACLRILAEGRRVRAGQHVAIA